MKHHIYFDYGYESSDQTKINLIKNNHFDGVFLFWREQLDEVVGQIRLASLTIETMHLPFENCNDLWLDAMTSNYWDLIIRGVKDAHRLGIPTVIFHVSSTANPPKMNEIGLQRFAQLLKMCEEYHINLALENLRRLDYIDFLFEKYPSTYLKFCFDSGHANAFTNNIAAFPWHKYQDKLYCLHLHDNNGLRDQHLPPFDGNINWKMLMHDLKKCSYQGPLTAEVVHRSYQNMTEEEYVTLVKRSLVKLESLWSQDEN
ncbi:MAG: sugar phosphate isomerase/epimerase [Bacilli bacterium]|nr:sugar phosphate isomerase/epimerase [Bacilli bacterium]